MKSLPIQVSTWGPFLGLGNLSLWGTVSDADALFSALLLMHDLKCDADFKILFLFSWNACGGMKRDWCFASLLHGGYFSLSLAQDQYPVSDAISLLQRVSSEGWMRASVKASECREQEKGGSRFPEAFSILSLFHHIHDCASYILTKLWIPTLSIARTKPEHLCTCLFYKLQDQTGPCQKTTTR